MVFGGEASERIQFNEDTVWQGEPHSYANKGAHRWLGQIRSLLLQGKQQEAEALAMDRFMSSPLRQKAYQSFGDLLIDRSGFSAADVTDYRRSLDLEDAVARVQFAANGVTHTQEVFASYPRQALVIRLAASGMGELSFTARLQTSHSRPGSKHPISSTPLAQTAARCAWPDKSRVGRFDSRPDLPFGQTAMSPWMASDCEWTEPARRLCCLRAPRTS